MARCARSRRVLPGQVPDQQGISTKAGRFMDVAFCSVGGPENRGYRADLRPPCVPGEFFTGAAGSGGVRKSLFFRGLRGAQGRNRTTDTVIFSHVLYQLSYLGADLAESEDQGERGGYRGSFFPCPGTLPRTAPSRDSPEFPGVFGA